VDLGLTMSNLIRAVYLYLIKIIKKSDDNHRAW
jgi:hypothetical protein